MNNVDLNNINTERNLIIDRVLNIGEFGVSNQLPYQQLLNGFQNEKDNPIQYFGTVFRLRKIALEKQLKELTNLISQKLK